MNYLPFAIAAPILMAIGNFIQKIVVSDKQVHGGIFGGMYGLLVALLTLPFALGTERLSASVFSSQVVGVLFLMTCLYAVAMWGFFTAMKHVAISEIVFLESATPIWVFFGSIMFLGESFSWNKASGVLFLVAGLWVAFNVKGAKRWTPYHTLGLISGALYAGAYMTDKYLLHYIPTLSYQVLSFGLPSIAILLFFGKRIHEARYFIVNPNARKIILAALFVGAGYYALFRAYQLSDAISVVNPIFETKALWVMILGIIFLNERTYLYRKILGMVFALVGILLVG